MQEETQSVLHVVNKYKLGGGRWCEERADRDNLVSITVIVLFYPRRIDGV